MKKTAPAVIFLILILILTGPAFAAGASSVYENEITLAVGESTALSTADDIVRLSSSDETTAVTDGTVITAIQAGTCIITAECADGTRYNIAVNVNPKAVRRALVLGEADYEGETYRIGSVNTTQGIADMLVSQKFGGTRCSVEMRMDVSRSEVFDLIGTAFAGATEYDISILYINCHGGVSCGIPYLRFHDNTRICAAELERALRKVPGIVVVMLDCCQSGAFLGDRNGTKRFVEQFTNVFSAFGSGGVFRTPKYKVLASCAYCQNSYRITTEKTVTETGMATVFARALCEGAGWDLIRDKVSPMKADADLDRRITLNDMTVYLKRRIPHYLTEAGVVQDVQVYPEGDRLVLFGR